MVENSERQRHWWQLKRNKRGEEDGGWKSEERDKGAAVEDGGRVGRMGGGERSAWVLGGGSGREGLIQLPWACLENPECIGPFFPFGCPDGHPGAAKSAQKHWKKCVKMKYIQRSLFFGVGYIRLVVGPPSSDPLSPRDLC